MGAAFTLRLPWNRRLKGGGTGVITFVNGFMCTSTCDAAKAQRGIDPHPNLHGADGEAGKPGKAGEPRNAGDPAVVFGGVLASILPTANDAGAPAPAPTLPGAGQFVDLLA
jgi:hypothetical protein